MKILAMLVLGMSLVFGTVDINSAQKEELMTLKGIGEKKADAIILYRVSNCFESVEGISKVNGIGEKFLENNRNNLEVGKCKK